MGVGIHLRGEQPKENPNNPKVHRQTVPVQQKEIRHKVLYATSPFGTLKIYSEQFDKRILV